MEINELVDEVLNTDLNLYDVEQDAKFDKAVEKILSDGTDVLGPEERLIDWLKQLLIDHYQRLYKIPSLPRDQYNHNTIGGVPYTEFESSHYYILSYKNGGEKWNDVYFALQDMGGIYYLMPVMIKPFVGFKKTLHYLSNSKQKEFANWFIDRNFDDIALNNSINNVIKDFS